MKLVTLLLPPLYLKCLDELVRKDIYPNRSAAIRMGVRDLLILHKFLQEAEPNKQL